MPGEAAGHLTPQLWGAGESACASGARCWGSLSLEELGQNPCGVGTKVRIETGRLPLCWGGGGASPLELSSSPFLLSLQHPLLTEPVTKEEYLKGPDLFSQKGNER